MQSHSCSDNASNLWESIDMAQLIVYWTVNKVKTTESDENEENVVVQIKKKHSGHFFQL